jgi:hypothetical protein
MCRAKQAGQSFVAIFDDSMRASLLAQAAAAQALRTVLTPGRHHDPRAHSQLSIAYRPFSLECSMCSIFDRKNVFLAHISCS